MNRKLKVLGMALFAAFAMSAVSASAASAVTHHITVTGDGGSTGLKASSIGEQKFYPTTNQEKRIQCKKVEVNGELPVTTNLSVTVEPIYKECKAVDPALGEPSATVTTNGCHYLFTGETTEEEGGTPGEHATVHLSCPEGEAIEIHVTFLLLPCTEVGEQTLHGVRYAEGPNNEDVIVEATVHGIHSTTVGACEEENPAENTHNDGKYTGNVTVQGTEQPISLTQT